MSATNAPRRLGCAWRTTVPVGIGAGTLYFIVIGALTIFTSVLGGQTLSLFGLVLFVGVGAGLGLILGLVVGAVLAAAVPLASTERAQRVVGAVAGGVPVLAFTVWEYATDTIGVLTPDVTTIVVIPTVVATIGSAAFAPRLVAETQPKRPEM